MTLNEAAQSETSPEVTVPSILMDLVPKYLENRRAEVLTLSEALKNGDFTAIKNIGHKLKGNAGSYGFDFLTDVGSLLEKGANAGDAATLQEVIQSYETFLNNVRVKSDSPS